MVRADNDEEEEELMGKGNCQNWAQVAQTLLIGREIWVGPKSLRENTFRKEIEIGSEKLKLLGETVSEMKC